MAKKIHFRLVQDEDGYPPVAVESLWAEPAATAGEYVLDNIPFFIRDATVGDTILARNEGGVPWFERVVSRSQNSLVRIVFRDRTCIDEIGAKLRAMGCATEYSAPHNLMAVSIPISIALHEVQILLRSEADKDRIDYEEPILRQ